MSFRLLIVLSTDCGRGAVVLSDIVPIETRGFYQSVNNLGWGLGGVLGAACGGYIADTVGWRWEFGLQVPFGIFCIIVLMCTIPDPEKIETAGLRERFKDFDFAGSVYLTSSLMFLILGLNLGGNVLPWGDYRILGSLAIGAILGALLLRAEQRAISPVMPLRLLWSAPRGLLIFNNVANMIIVNSVLFNLPLYFQAVRGESAAEAGGRLFIPSIAGTFAGVSTGLIITRTGRLHDTLYFGAILLIIGCGMFCVMPPNLPFWGYFIFLIPVNLGSGFVMPSSLLSILATSSQEEQAVATSTLIMWRSLGGVLGVALSSLIVQNGLNTFLERDITGPNKQEIIDMVRKSVNSIYGLDPIHKAEGIVSFPLLIVEETKTYENSCPLLRKQFKALLRVYDGGFGSCSAISLSDTATKHPSENGIEENGVCPWRRINLGRWREEYL